MESLAQELLEAIIDYVPPPHADSCSLVARRWRRRSQQRHFSHLRFFREEEVVRWCENIPQDPNGIPSYADDVEFQTIDRWCDPTLLTRALKCFSRVKTLRICGTVVPSGEVHDIVSSGAFGGELTSLALLNVVSPPPPLLPLILLFLSLRELRIGPMPTPPAFMLPEKTWRGEPLRTLRLSRLSPMEFEFIVLCGITSRRISLDVGDVMIEKIIACSSELVSELVLNGTRSVEFCARGVILTSLPDIFPRVARPTGGFPPVVHLPPLPALTTMEFMIRSRSPSARLVDILSCIRSAPALSSITFKFLAWHVVGGIPTVPSQWTNVDKWLARLATHVAARRSLMVVILLRSKGDSRWEERLPEFRKAGGQLRVEVDTDSEWD